MPPTEITTFQILTLVIAGLGFVLGACSLVWQWYSWHRSGPRIRVEMRIGVVMPGGVASKPVDRDWRAAMEQFRGQGTTPVLGVRVSNSGRAPTSIRGLSVALDSAIEYSEHGRLLGPDLPCRLEAHADETWFIVLEGVLRAIWASAGVRQTKSTCVVVELVGGKTLRTPQTINSEELLQYFGVPGAAG